MSGSIAIGADHAGYALKETLKAYLDKCEVPYVDLGCFSEDSVDYPDFAAKVAQSVQSGDCVQGVLCCGSGVGVAITANRFPGVRAVVCHDPFITTMSRRHNDANVICFGARIVAAPYAIELLDVFLNTPFEAGRHQKRVDKMRTVCQGASVSC